MLAKVLKNSQGTDFRLFSVPELGENSFARGSTSAFIVPSIGDLHHDYLDVHSEPITEMDDESILSQAHNEAEQIIAQAQENAAIILQVATDKAAFAAAANIESEINQQVSDLRRRLTETIDSVAAISTNIKAGSEIELVELAMKIARKIVSREVTIDREIALTLVKVSLAKLHNRSAAEVHLNPEDFAFVNAHREKLDYRGALDVVEDRSISPGGCLIHTETGDIDARIESQFDEISHGLFA